MRMPFLQELISMLANLSLQRAQFMLRHATDGSKAAVAQLKLRFLPTLPRVYMGRLAPFSTVEQENPALPSQNRRHVVIFLPISWV
jgi:hypothetical protein